MNHKPTVTSALPDNWATQIVSGICKAPTQSKTTLDGFYSLSTQYTQTKHTSCAVSKTEQCHTLEIIILFLAYLKAFLESLSTCLA